ncbi:exopolysaccharide biosynthesis protein [Chthonobacter albigriseus]|uniref:exopolysaccharide biosynthesis protein n=1 Tax=Chthonobacter albigriseus TaxID=1683161 RepID=UPI00313FE56B
MKKQTEDGSHGHRRLDTFLARRRSRSRPPRFSTVLRLLGEEPDERITFIKLIETFGDRVFGALMFIFAVPNVIPLPPGTSAVLGAPLLLIAAQLAVGRRTLWLPPAIRERSIARADFRNLIGRTLPYLRWTERLLAPRLLVMFGPLGDRLIGIACLLLAVILFLPIPLGNMLPGLAISFFSLALLQRDGVAALVGWITAVISVGVLVAISGALWIGVKAFWHALF